MWISLGLILIMGPERIVKLAWYCGRSVSTLLTVDAMQPLDLGSELAAMAFEKVKIKLIPAR